MPIHEVMKAERYRWGAMSSLGDAAYMILNQFNFPAEYDDEKDVLIGADHDRCQMWDRDHFDRCCDEHLHTGPMAIGQWAMDCESPQAVMDFIVDALKANEQCPGRKWTGWRVLGSVHRANGYPIFYLQVISQKSKFTKYTGQAGENVK